jgi:DNA-binding MarR family transcriptional regulator
MMVTFHDEMIRLIRALGVHNEERTPCGKPISISEAHALMELHTHTNLTQTRLGELLHLEKSTISRLVKQMERRQWIHRKRDEQDNRYVQLSLTTQGERIASQLEQSRKKMFHSIMDHIPTEQQHAVTQSLQTLITAIGKTRNSPLPTHEYGGFFGNPLL